MSRLRFAAALALPLLLAGPARAADPVELTVHNALDQPRQGAPLTVGVPFGPGELSSLDALRATGPGGSDALPFQARAMSTWADGSPRWVLFDFPVDVGPQGQALYTLHSDGAGPAGSPLVAEDDGAGITIRTGVVELRLERQAFRVLQSASLDRDGDGSYETAVVLPGASAGLVLSGPAGEEWSARFAPVAELSLKEAGDQRVTVVARGTLTDSSGNPVDCNYQVRVSAWANSGDVRVQATLTNPRKGGLSFHSDNSFYFDDARIELATAVDGGQALLGGDDGDAPQAWTLGSGHVYLHQDSSGDLENFDRYATRKRVSYNGWRAFAGATGGEQQIASGERAQGWLALAGDGLSVGVGIAEFWQNFPNALDAWGDGRVAARFFSRYQAGEFHLRGGEQKTHMVHLRLAEGDGSAAGPALRSAMAPMLALASPEYYASTGSFKRFLPRDAAEAFPEFDNWEAMQRATLYGGVGYRDDRNIFTNIARDDLYGWLDWGDQHADYEHNGDRANGENDLSYGMALQMVRSGDPKWFEVIAPLARQLADIDVYHTQEEDGGWEWRNGGFFEHDRTGTNRHRGVSFPQPNHYNAQGMFTYAYMSGDPVVMESAIEVARNAKYRTDKRSGGYSYVDSDELRSPAWMMNVVMEGWKATGEQGFLDTLHDMIDRTHPDTRCWPAGPGCPASEIKGIYKNYINMWELGMLMESIGALLDEFQRNGMSRPARGIEALQQYGDFIHQYAWMPAEGTFGKRFDFADGSMGADDAPGNILRVIDGLVHAYNHTGDASLLEHLDESFATSTANPWYDGSGVTYADIKMQSVLAKHGHAYMELLGRGVSPPRSCLEVQGTDPGDGNDWDPDLPLGVVFTRAPEPASLRANLSASGDRSGTLAVTVTLSGRSAGLSFDPQPLFGEVVTVTIGGGTLALSDGMALDGDGDGECGGDHVFSVVAASLGSGGPDDVDPDPIGDLSLDFDPLGGGAIARWTAPSDEGPTGRPASYELRVQGGSPEAPFDWASAEPVEGLPRPAAPGVAQEFALGLRDSQGGTLRIAMISRDAAGNASGLSNVAGDETGPTLLSPDGNLRSIGVGETLDLVFVASDERSGRSPVVAARYRFDGEDVSEARSATVSNAPSAWVAGVEGIVASAAGWPEGETHVVLVEAQDAVGNWGEPFVLGLEVGGAPTASFGCPRMEQHDPPSQSRVSQIESVLLLFDAPVEPSSVDPALDVIGPSGLSMDPQFQWLVEGRALRLAFRPVLAQPGQLRLVVNEAQLIAMGQDRPAGRVDNGCGLGPVDLVYTIEPDGSAPGGMGPWAGTSLGEVESSGIIAIDGFDLRLSELEPGGVLRVFTPSGQLVHEMRVDSDQASVDAVKLEGAPARLLIVAYRGRHQKVVVGEGQSYLSYLP